KLAALKLLENSSGGVKLEAHFGNGGHAALRFRITTGEALLELQSTTGSGSAEIQSDAQYIVVSDYFGNDLGYDATRSSGPVPAENFCLHLLEGGDALLMNVWQSNEQQATLLAPAVAQAGARAGNRIGFLKDKSIWIALLESPGLWSSRITLAKDDKWQPP